MFRFGDMKEKRFFPPELNLSLPLVDPNDIPLSMNILSIFFSDHSHMRVQALIFNKLKILDMWTKKTCGKYLQNIDIDTPF